jgi:TonB-dependent receptor
MPTVHSVLGAIRKSLGLCSLFLAGAVASAAQPAFLSGVVVDAEGAGLAAARIQIQQHEAKTDPRGAFAVGGLVPGRYIVTISAPGHRSVEVPVQLTADANVLPPITLVGEVLQMEKVVVAEQKAGAEAAFADKTAADALAEIVSGAALKSATAQSANDLLKNVSGVSVSRGGDGASNITVRGMDSRFVRVTVDGQRQGGSNALDSIPPEIIQSLEVSKVLTPDQEADAIGGAINITTGTANLKDAYVQGRHQLIYNPLEARPGIRNTLTVVRPLHWFARNGENPNAGLLLTAGFEDQHRRRESIRLLREWPALVSPGPSPFTGQLIPVLTQPRIDTTLEHRQRVNVVFNGDARFGAATILWRSNFTHDWAKRDRQLLDFDPFLGTPLVLTPDHAVFAGVPQNRRDQRQTVQRDAANFVFGGKTILGRAEVDATLGAALSDEKEPRTTETVFRNDRTFRTTYETRDSFLPRFTFVDETSPGDFASLSDPSRYYFNHLTDSRTETRDREYAAKLDVKLNLGTLPQSNFLKFGGKLLRRDRVADTDRRVFDPGAQARNMTGVVGTPFVSLRTMTYGFGPVPDATAVAALLNTAPAIFQPNHLMTLVNSTTGDYAVTETIGAAYAMGRFKRDRWAALAGVRMEDTRVESEGNQLVIGPAGNVQSVTPAQANRSYLLFLPGVHVRFDPKPGWLLRGSATRALNRPNYIELTPARQINFIDRRSRVGNPDLKPYDAANFDVSVDRYHERAGLLSLGLFFKRIKHVIQDAQYPITIGDLGQFIEFQRINGESARVWGMETSWKSAKVALPASLGTSSFALNYTFLHSDTRIPSRPGEVFTLKAQPNHLVNMMLSAERGRFSTEATLRYRSKTFEDVIDPGFDNYRIGALDAELSVAFKLGKDTRLTLGVSNLLNQPVREYSGTRARINQYDRAGTDFTLGLQWKLPITTTQKAPLSP